MNVLKVSTWLDQEELDEARVQVNEGSVIVDVAGVELWILHGDDPVGLLFELADKTREALDEATASSNAA